MAERLNVGVAARLSRYLQVLTQARKMGKTRISSQEIADYTNINATQIRRDLSNFGKFGKRGVGYSIEPLLDAILEDRGVLILPDVLANAGGVVVSYFEWVQGLQEYFWKEVEVNAKLNDIMSRAFDQTWDTAQSRKLPMRVAAYGLAVQRVAEATVTRGIYP